MRLFRPLQFVLVMSALSVTAVAQPQVTATKADVDVWVAAIIQIRREQSKDLALVNETVPAAEFRDRLSGVTRERVLIDKLLLRNNSSFLISSNVTSSIELVDAKSVRKSGRGEFDTNVISARFGQRNRRLLRLSLPVFSDDGARALVYTWAAGGFDDFRGGGYLFERKQGEWIIVDYLARWIT
jgi:hypothetical protein